MTDESEALASAQGRIAELEVEFSARSNQQREQIQDLSAQLDQARINDADLKNQLERCRINTNDVLRQLEAVRVERLHLVERLRMSASSRASPWRQLFTNRAFDDPIPPEIARTRRKLSRRYIRGSGLEIGALHSPMSVKRNASVTYVDRFATVDLRREYPEWDHSTFVEVDLIDDGEQLEKVANQSQDFVIASHMIEHCENPLGTLRCHLSKLKPDGVLFYIVPDRRGSFDVDRPLTTFEHILRDDREGPEGSRWDHYLEFSELANRSPEDEIVSIAKQMMEAKSSIHFHVWEPSTFRIFLERSNEILDQSFSVEYCEINHAEIIAVLRKSDA